MAKVLIVNAFAITGRIIVLGYGITIYLLLPDLCTLVLRDEELVALLHVECLVPGINLRKGSVYASLSRRVRVGVDLTVDEFRTCIACPDVCP